MDALLTPQEAADHLRLSVATLATWRSRAGSDGPPWIEVGGLVRYQRSDLDAWVEARKRGA